MKKTLKSSKILLYFAIALISFAVISCTSPEAEDQSVLDAELDNLDSDPSLVDEGEEGAEDSEIEDIDEAAQDELEDELEEAGGDDEDDEDDGDGFEDEDEELEDELAEDDDEDEDEDDEGDEDDDFEEEFASDDEDEDEDGDDEDEDEEADGDDEDEEDEEDDEEDEEALAKELEGEEDYPTAAGGDGFPEDVQKANAGGDGQQPPPGQPPMDAAGAPPGQEPIISVTVDSSPEPPAPTVPQDDLGTPDPLVAKPDDYNAGQNWVPVVKIKTDPFFRNTRLMNTVYVARPGDTLESISSKLFGSTSKASTLLDDNPHLDRGIDPGDKVYYNSPNNPDAKSNIKVHYEDIELKPNRYITKLGDNMRRMGSKLLGFQEGWKEIWAINLNVDSKTELTPGIELRYWTGDEGKIMAKAEVEETPPVPEIENTPPVPTPEENMAPEPPSIADNPPAPPDIPDVPPTTEDPAMAVMDPEPLPEADISDEPEPSQASMDEKPPEDAGTSLLTVGLMALVVLAGATLVAIQIKNRKAQAEGPPPSLEFTQV